MRQNKFIRKCGPYKVESISQQPGGVRLVVYPAYPDYGEWAIEREKGEGGGPNIFTCIALAQELEKFLNQPYASEEIVAWHKVVEKLPQEALR